ncbi:DNA polymerase III subunit chi [Ketogulonicigenium vulgare]|uniref:DNA polymerase III subunit chi n=1 Tax=Ketogulonicigenium vulgare (strain WSH-001) TaxID=759362 RepID=F9Y6W7_KETVW|nr:DNA polymerase III subunit chi [Ketogulonicigenium vulgare]ADO42799.1 DNA polymerase III subunit chi [Ketogulonicigenium vulgare Y25]AEM40984.1 DNA polymerase III subunit chi [Ketogulonicigenium vulgare WSH-001]ALJ81136.1 DNA polymerase III subunit chi [Ketogulonicigenium vulgare]ANW33885.1 DNA polymerase III subunit chi [Ketogulonicigenium vulgare]AOZ54711.1 DNA polymerase III subunit chi [Ketogulonicigenium vulgare]
MAEIQFFQLFDGPVAATLPVLLNRSLERGWRVILRGTDPARMAALDVDLWRRDDDGFLPHGLAGGPHDALQPVLLTTGDGLPDGDCLICVDMATATPAECASLERVVLIFDGHDPQALDHARGEWKALTGQGVPASYFAQEDGRWVKKAERA